MTAAVHAISRPATEFTGDFYLYRREPGRLRFSLGDVSGKGLRAAVLMAMVQEEIERGFGEGDEAIEIVQAVHRALLPEMGGRKFVSLVVGDLDSSGRLTLVNAGHCLPLIIRRTGVDLLPSTGPVAGLLADSEWFTHTGHLESGEAIVLYTDGVIEATSTDGSELGVEGLVRALHPCVDADPRSIAGEVSEILYRHRGEAPLDDDATILALVARPAVSEAKHDHRARRAPRGNVRSIRREGERVGNAPAVQIQLSFQGSAANVPEINAAVVTAGCR
jgi:sigma-B regulation protein RsbU (phosphoserine phosphatase)